MVPSFRNEKLIFRRENPSYFILLGFTKGSRPQDVKLLSDLPTPDAPFVSDVEGKAQKFVDLTLPVSKEMFWVLEVRDMSNIFANS